MIFKRFVHSYFELHHKLKKNCSQIFRLQSSIDLQVHSQWCLLLILRWGNYENSIWFIEGSRSLLRDGRLLVKLVKKIHEKYWFLENRLLMGDVSLLELSLYTDREVLSDSVDDWDYSIFFIMFMFFISMMSFDFIFSTFSVSNDLNTDYSNRSNM